jgi:L-alanine-DL-glutamate epimerase-like enolase superfamily enzyme
VVDGVLADGHRAIKLKVGYDAERDARDVGRVRDQVGPEIDLMLDANQAWDIGQASEAITGLAAHGIAFFEEPLLATEPPATWAELARRTGATLAAGENVPDDIVFGNLVRASGVQIIQPDVAKWGGLTGTAAVSREARSHGATVCPHFMGTAIGLAASLHLLAVAGGGGRVELDANPNPLRTELAGLDLGVCDGALSVPTGPGLGVEPDPKALRRFALDPAA